MPVRAELALACLLPACFLGEGLLACSKMPGASGSGGDPLAGAACGAVKMPAEPDLLAWESATRAQLDKLRRQGVVAVRYEAHGCEVSLELLPQCIGPKNRYVYSPVSAVDTKIARNVDELLAQLPLGAATIARSLDGKVLRADARVVGTAALATGSTISEYDLVGPECKRATHVVSTVYLGGFAIAALPTAASATSVFGGSLPVETLVHEGIAPICERAATEGLELGGCSAPLRVGLIRIEGKVPPPTCPSAWTFDGTRCVRPASAATDAGVDAASSAPKVFDQLAIERVVRERSGAVKRRCWDDVSPKLRRMNLSVRAAIDTSGHVARAEPVVADAEGPADLAASVARCVAREVHGWVFPEPDTARTITLPFHLLRQ